MSGRFWGTKRSRICHHIAARSGSNAAELSPKLGLKLSSISAATTAQTGQQCVFLLHFLSAKDAENAPLILNFPPIFVTAEHQNRGELRS
jgi:hypothetical protein